MRYGIFGFGAGLGLGLALGATVLAPLGAIAGSKAGGHGYLGTENETLKWKTFKGSPETETFQRLVHFVPDDYGKLIAVGGSELWFQDTSGVVRNVILPTVGATPNLVRVQRQP